MTLLRLNDVSLTFGHTPLLSHLDFQIEPRERVCLVGRNGTGKSTLLRVITGTVLPDEGTIWRQETLTIAHLEQEVPPNTEQTVFEVVAGGLGKLGAILTQYHQLTHQVKSAESTALARLAQLQVRMDALGGWNIKQKVDTVLTRLGLPADRRLTECSGGIRRQVMLAHALVSHPDLLLLDEPTNHLDIKAITWLEKFLLAFRGALIFITHDRTLLKHLATRIIDLDRGKLTSFPGDFAAYQGKKEQLLDSERRASAKFDKALAEEEAWIRRGIKARRTRNEGRVKALEAMRRVRSQRLEAQGKSRFNIEAGVLSGKLVADLRRLSFNYGDNPIVRDLSTRIIRGDRVGIIGPNGCGKSTLLKLILGKIPPTSGQVVRGTRLNIAYFDQQRGQLDAEKTVRENIGEDSDYVTVKNQPRHVIGYLKDFLFPPERIDTPVKALSGGERNRLALAKIFTGSANLMVLDEPTNDLDVDTLELLEDLLSDYEGTLLLVSHDRTFVDNVVTSTLVFEGEGRIEEYAGGYEEWERYRERIAAQRSEVPRQTSTAPLAADSARKLDSSRPRKLSYNEQRELEVLPEKIADLEAERAQLHSLMGDGDFYRQSKDKITAAMERLEAVKTELETCYERWEVLESMAAAPRI